MATIHKMEVNEPHFTHIYRGIKTVEGRKRSDTWKYVKVGDELLIVPKQPSTKEPFRVQVVYINSYMGPDPLFSYLMSEGLNRALPDVNTITEAIAVYLEFWSAAEIKKLGMYGFGLKLIEK